jgi:pyruvate-formate lyase
VQCALGNTCPLQLDLSAPHVHAGLMDLSKVAALLRAHFDLGGTMANVNIIDKATLLDAREHPEKYPDLIVRVTGFSAYFSSLSDELRQYVVDRVVNGS